MKHSIKLFTLITLFYCLFTSCNDEVESYRETEKNIENVYPVAIKSFMRTKAAVVQNKQWEQKEKIGIKFLNGTTSQQTKVMEYAREWEKHINLRFVLDSQNPSVIIHIANPDLDEVDKVNWSYLGTDNTKIARTGEATMNLVLKSGDENTEYFKGIVLMEFGHVLGLIYEYQRYAGDLSIKYNINVDYSAINDLIFDHWRSDYEGIWELEGVSVSEEDVVHTLVQPDGEVVKLDWSFDPQSIMLPYFGNSIIYYKEFPLRNVISKPNTKLSEKDIAYIKQIYPKGDGEELQPDPFVKGRREERVYKRNLSIWNANFEDSRDWDQSEIIRSDWSKATYPIQEIDEYWWFAKSIITDYRFRKANDTYLNWLGYSDAEINNWNNGYLKPGQSPLTNETMNTTYGSPMFLREGVHHWLPLWNTRFDEWNVYYNNQELPSGLTTVIEEADESTLTSSVRSNSSNPYFKFGYWADNWLTELQKPCTIKKIVCFFETVGKVDIYLGYSDGTSYRESFETVAGKNILTLNIPVKKPVKKFSIGVGAGSIKVDKTRTQEKLGQIGYQPDRWTAHTANDWSLGIGLYIDPYQELIAEEKGTWRTPEYEDMMQLIGQAPRTTDNIFLDIMNFLGANSDTDNLPYNFKHTYEGISGLNLYPLGAKGGGYKGEGQKPPLVHPIENSYIDGTGETINGFGMYSAIHIGEWNDIIGKNTHKRLLFVSGNVFGGPEVIRIDPGYPNAVQSAQVRYCSKKSDEELGYKMYIDENNDKILILDFPLSEVDQKTVESLKELPKGLLRGIALRYTNREQRQVCNSLSEIKNEAKNYDTIIKK